MLLILTGPPGAGKNTVAEALARKKERCAVIDVDLVRWMVLQPHKASWEGDDGARQQELGVKNACLLAASFIKEGYDAIVLDVLSNATGHIYKRELGRYEPKIVLLLPTYEEIRKRNGTRPPRLTEDEVAMLYAGQQELREYDVTIDNSRVTAEEMAERLHRLA